MDIEPSRIEDAIEAYGDTAVPWLADNAGFCSALLLVDERTGHAISETVWQNVEALAASRSVAAAIRVETVEATDCRGPSGRGVRPGGHVRAQRRERHSWAHSISARSLAHRRAGLPLVI